MFCRLKYVWSRLPDASAVRSRLLQLQVAISSVKTIESRSKMTAIVIILLICVVINATAASDVAVVDGSDKQLHADATRSLSEQQFLTYIRASIPGRIFQCMNKLTMNRCVKIFLLQRLEEYPLVRNTGNLTSDFLHQFVFNDRGFPNLTSQKYSRINDAQLSQKLAISFKKFFKGRNIELHFLPEVLVRVVPNTENRIKLSFKKGHLGRSNKQYKKIIQMAVPVMIMPFILMSSFLPFMLPAIKMTAIMSTLMNNGAFMAALFYAARTVAMSNEQPIYYSYPGHH